MKNNKSFVPRNRWLKYCGELVAEHAADILFDEGVIDVTDPCYDKDVWCRLNGVKIVPGEYQVNTYTSLEEDRVFILQIVLKDDSVISDFESKTQNINHSWRKLDSSIGVDAGICGFFQNKPDFTGKEWDKFCTGIKYDSKGNLWSGEKENQRGFFTESGWGDGVYGVYAIRRAVGGKATPRIVALELRFI